MEYDDIPLHDLLGVGDEPAPGPDDLRRIVSRAGRLRNRIAAVGAVVALGVGAGIGYAVSNHSTHSVQTAGSSSQNGPGGASSAGAEPGSASYGFSSSGTSGSALVTPYGGFKLTPLFTRTVGSVTIRGFLEGSQLPEGMMPGCVIGGPTLRAEVSTPKMVGLADGAFGYGATASGGTAIGSTSSVLLGVAEGDPVAVVTVHTASNVASVRMQFAGAGSDQMAPVKGWASLASPDSSLSKSQQKTSTQRAETVGSLTAFDAAGKQLAKQGVSLGVNVSNVGAPAAGASSSCFRCAYPPLSTPPLTVPAGGATVNPGGPMIPTNGSASGSGFACPVTGPAVQGANGSSSSTGTSAPTPASP